MKPAVVVSGVSKRFKLGAFQGKYRTLRESLMSAAAAPVARVRRMMSGAPAPDAPSTDLWALDDVSFSVKPGEAVGIVGRNGAGKSTLLKIVSRITSPTKGRIELRGRVGSLLEVGTGFHPELTGRENVFLNGAIIGMSRKEIARKFDAIVEFSEVARFIDTPVKRYSSGMYVRLAFAVAAHMEPDILLIDEVLSVGDLSFQRKCMDHAKQMLKRNVTLLFVSHNMFAVKALCNRAVYLSRGKLAADGSPEEVTRLYDSDSRLDVAAWAQNMVGSDPKKCPIYIEHVEMTDEAGNEKTIFDFGQRMRLRLQYTAREPVTAPNFNVSFIRSDDVAVCNFNTAMDQFDTGEAQGAGVIEMLTPPLKLVAELYTVQIMIWDRRFSKLYSAQQAKSFHVRHELLSTEFGVFHEPAEWNWANADAVAGSENPGEVRQPAEGCRKHFPGVGLIRPSRDLNRMSDRSNRSPVPEPALAVRARGRVRLGIVDLTDAPTGVSRYVEAILAGIDAEEFDVTIFCVSSGPHAKNGRFKIVICDEVFGPHGIASEASPDAGAASAGATCGGVDRARSTPRHQSPDRSFFKRIARGVWRNACPPSARLWAGFWRQSRRLAAIFRRHPVDLLHVQALNCDESVVGARLAGVPVLQTVHIDASRSLPRHWPLEAITFRCADRSIAVSENIRRQWTKRAWLAPSRITTIRNGVDVDFFAPADRATARRKLGIEPGRLVVGGVGRLMRQKGYADLLEAAAPLASKFEHLTIVLAGGGPLEGELRAQAARLGIAGRVIFLGYQSDVRDAYAAMDAFALPSLWEAMPFSVLEAMACGLAVVATDVAGVPEAVRQGETGLLVAASNPGELSAALERLMRSETDRRRMGEAGRRRVVEQFSASLMVRRTLAEYRRTFETARTVSMSRGADAGVDPAAQRGVELVGDLQRRQNAVRSPDGGDAGIVGGT